MRTIAHLCDHQAEVYRAEVTTDSLGDRIESWREKCSPDGLNCRPNQAWSGTLQDHGPGEQQRAMRTWYLVPGFDVQPRDVLKVVYGPECGMLMRVESVTHPTARFGVNHIEVNVEVWHGSLS